MRLLFFNYICDEYWFYDTWFQHVKIKIVPEESMSIFTDLMNPYQPRTLKVLL